LQSEVGEAARELTAVRDQYNPNQNSTPPARLRKPRKWHFGRRR
jgi:hypothetical protein